MNNQIKVRNMKTGKSELFPNQKAASDFIAKKSNPNLKIPPHHFITINYSHHLSR